ncbi:MAG: endonuclease III [Acidobacteria bacterium]|nr:MAG: endonuclease III [Acidobacteriota bacterium]
MSATMPRKRRFTPREQASRAARILRALDRAYPDARCALVHSNPLELLVATILSAQCTDERVNIVTRELFRKYRTPEDYVRAPRELLESEIRSTGFFRNKAKSIQGACRAILERFGGKVPATLDELVELPGVARKTANVVLGVAFGRAEGIVVDTHVLRVSRRLELTRETDPAKVERDLMALVPRKKWIDFSHQVIHHGRRVCRARKPLCHVCPVEKLCRSEDKTRAFPPPAGSPRS